MAWTTPKTWSVGETLTAANFNTHIRDNGNATVHVLARKSADETVNNSNTLQNDDHLSFAIGSTEVWWFQAYLMVDSNATADIKFAWTVPAGGTMAWGYDAAASGTSYGSWHSVAVSSSPQALIAAAASQEVGSAASASIWGVSLSGITTTAGTSGTVQLQWAQNTATVVNTIVKQNSCILGVRLA